MPRVRSAKSTMVFACQDGNIHIALLDEDMNEFARASYSQDVFADLLADGARVLQAVRDGGLAMMPVGGSA